MTLSRSVNEPVLPLTLRTVIAPRLFTRFPVSIMLAFQFGLMAVWPAIRYHNPALHFILWITAVGVGVAFATEMLVVPLRRGPVRVGASRLTVGPAKFVLVLGIVALYSSAALGARTFASQVGATSTSPLAPLLTPFIPWVMIGSAFILYLYARGDMGQRETKKWMAVSVTAYLGYSIIIGRSAPFAAFALGILVGSVLVGLVRPRTLLIAATVAILAWPTLYTIRNEVRSGFSTGRYGEQVDPSERLREDLFLGIAAKYPESVDVGQPSVPQILRYGLIPRALDPFNRPELLSGRALSARVGQSSSSSLTFTNLANMRFLGGGTVAMIGYVAALAAMVTWLLRTLTPVRFALVLSMFQFIFWIESGWPDPLAAIPQALVAAGAAMVLVTLAQAAGRTADRRSGRRRPRVAR